MTPVSIDKSVLISSACYCCDYTSKRWHSKSASIVPIQSTCSQCLSQSILKPTPCEGLKTQQKKILQSLHVLDQHAPECKAQHADLYTDFAQAKQRHSNKQEGQKSEWQLWAMALRSKQKSRSKSRDGLAWDSTRWIMLADAAFISFVTHQSCRGDPDASPVLAGTPTPAQTLDQLPYRRDLCYICVPSLYAANTYVAHVLRSWLPDKCM